MAKLKRFSYAFENDWSDTSVTDAEKHKGHADDRTNFEQKYCQLWHSSDVSASHKSDSLSENFLPDYITIWNIYRALLLLEL